MTNFIIHNGNCIDVMRTMADNSVDSIVTDPPYELNFMGSKWDNTGIAFNVEVWTEALRVLKPGGHLLAFSGSRTYHRMAVAIEDAGFQIRDQIMWLYGSGFPKSLDVPKAIDKAAGAVREQIRHKPRPETSGTMSGSGDTRPWIELARQQGFYETDGNTPITPEAQQWAGWGTALKPAHEPIVLARKPLIGTVAANVLEHGTGGLNIDGSRVAHASADDLQKHASGVQAIKERGGVMADSWKNSSDLSGANDVSVAGRFPANIIHDGSDEVLAGFPITSPARRSLMGAGGIPNGANNLVGSNVERNQDFESVRGHTDSGTAARFFYCAKASKRDRNEGLDGFEEKQSAGGGGGIGDYQDDVNSASGKFGSEKAPAANHHPTVKPTDLMRYLVKLITPPNGIVLDPFTGSGSTGKGAVIEGFTFIGIELDPDYVAIATARIQHQIDTKPETEPTLFNQTN